MSREGLFFGECYGLYKRKTLLKEDEKKTGQEDRIDRAGGKKGHY